MLRRNFIKSSALTIAAVPLGVNRVLGKINDSSATMAKKFKLNYASHFGMFKNSAGDDLVDQLKFISDQGFTALEDNRMKDKPISVQEF